MKIFLKNINVKMMKKVKYPAGSGKIFFSPSESGILLDRVEKENAIKEKEFREKINKKWETKNALNKRQNQDDYSFSPLAESEGEKGLAEETIEVTKKGDAAQIEKVKAYMKFTFIPIAFHTGICLFDYLFYGTCYINSFRLFFKHNLLLNSFLVGMIFSNLKEAKEVKSLSNLFKKSSFLAFQIGSILGCSYCMLYVPMSYYFFFPLYLFYTALNSKNLSDALGSKKISGLEIFQIIILTLMFVLVSTQYAKYRKSLEEAKNFETVIKSYELSSDSEFKKVMDKHEDYLDEIDVKFEKRKE